MKPAKRRLVLVTWLDSMRSPDWMGVDEHLRLHHDQRLACSSAGWVLSDGKSALVLASSVHNANNSAAQVMAIPRQAVLSVVDLVAANP